MTLYAHKSLLVTANRAEADGILYTIGADIPIKKGGIFITDQNDNSFPITDEQFNENYIPVERVVKKQPRKLHKSPFEELYEKALIEFNQVELNQNEEENYINEMINNKYLNRN